MTNDNSEYDDLMDELASIRPKQSESNPIPERAAQQCEESRQRAMEEKEKDYYANKKPTGSGVHKKRNKGLNSSFDDIFESTPTEISSLHEKFPEIYTDDIYLQPGEKCYFYSKVQLIDRKVVKDYLRKSIGASMPGLFKGDRWGSGFSWKKEVGEHEERSAYTGMLYVTSKRTIFVEKTKGFDKRHTSISAIMPYSDGIEIQYGSKTYLLMTEDAVQLYELYELLH